jgi:hypothetical protein
LRHFPPLDDAAGIERTIREYFESLDDVRPLAAGAVGSFLEAISSPAEWPGGGGRVVERHLEVRRIALERVENDVAEVAFDAKHRVREAEGAKGGSKGDWSLSGPVVLERPTGTWRVCDYVLNGRPRSESLRLRLTGQQEIDGLTLTAVAVDLRTDITAVWIHVENRRESPVAFGWASLGTRRKGGWKFTPLDLGEEVKTGWSIGPLVAGAVLPLDTRELRLIVVERGRQVGFDFIVDLEPQVDYQPIQRRPDALPPKLRVQRSPLGVLIGLLLLVAAGLVLGSWRAVGFVMLAFGGITSLEHVYGLLQRRRIHNWRPMVGTVLALTIGAAILVRVG